MRPLVLALAVLVLAPASAGASPFHYADERDAMGDPEVASVVDLAISWWRAEGWEPCTPASGLVVRRAPDLDHAGGRSAECDVWLWDGVLAVPGDTFHRFYQLTAACGTAMHELGHTVAYLAKLAGRLPADLDDHEWMAAIEPKWEKTCTTRAYVVLYPDTYTPDKGWWTAVRTPRPVAARGASAASVRTRARARRFVRRMAEAARRG